jgi:hypothetical protein
MRVCLKNVWRRRKTTKHVKFFLFHHSVCPGANGASLQDEKNAVVR